MGEVVLHFMADNPGDWLLRGDDSAMETLQRRYTRDDIDEEEFQRRRERLVENQGE